MTNKFTRKIRGMSDKKLDSLESAMRTELIGLRGYEKQGGSIRNSAGFRNLRRNIARILTVKNERQEKMNLARKMEV